MILLHDNALHTVKLIKEMIEAFGWKYYRMRLTHQIWFRPIITYLHRWDTHLLSSASRKKNTKMYENG